MEVRTISPPGKIAWPAAARWVTLNPDERTVSRCPHAHSGGSERCLGRVRGEHTRRSSASRCSAASRATEATPTSDVDVVVQFTPGSLPRGLAGFAFLDDLEGELSRELGFPVNLITTGSLQTASRIGNHSLPRAVARDGHLVYALESAAN